MQDPIASADDNKQAAFIVTGKVIKTNAATMQEIATQETLILQIETIIKAPSMFAALVSQQITVRFPKMPDVKEGATMTIYANGWIFGETIAVDAVDYSTVSDKREVISKATAEMATVEDTSLKERLDSAESAVVGKVTKIEKKEDPPKRVSLAADTTETTHISEHDPNWHEATIRVDETLKGTSDAKEVKVAFPKSDDVRWVGIPKFHQGQEGVWLLQKGKAQNTRGLSPRIIAAIPEDENILTTLHANDFLPLSELGKIKSLINQ